MARDDTYVKAITVNGESVQFDLSAAEIEFAHAVELLPGENQVDIIIEDILGKRIREQVTLDRDADGPAMSFDTPVAIPGTIRGVVFDISGVAEVLIGGMPATLLEMGPGLTSFSAEISSDELQHPPAFESVDNFGNVTRGIVPVDTLIVTHSMPVPLLASTGNTLIPLSEGLHAVMVGGEMLAVTVAQAEASSADGPEVSFLELRAGQQYRLDEINVQLKVKGPNPIVSATVNELPIKNIIPGRPTQHLSRHLDLNDLGAHEITARVRDSLGAAHSVSVSVEKMESLLATDAGRLKAVVLGSVWQDSQPLFDGAAGYVADRLERSLQTYRRFTFLNRSELPEILSEQQLSQVLGDRDERLALEMIKPADIMLVGKIYGDSDSVDIVVEAASTETGVKVATIEVAGTVKSRADLDQLVDDLGLRLIQAFPVAQGQVVDVKGWDSLISNLGEAQRIVESLKCVVYREGDPLTDPTTGAILAVSQEILGYGLVESVRGLISTLRYAPVSGDPALVPIQRGDRVATK